MTDNEGAPKEQLRRHAIYRKQKSLDQSSGHYGNSGYCSLAQQTGIDKEVLEKLLSETVTLSAVFQGQMDSMKGKIEQIQNTVQELLDQQSSNLLCHQCHQTKSCNRDFFIRSPTALATMTKNDVNSDSKNFSFDSKETDEPLYDNNVNIKANFFEHKFSNPIYGRFQEHDSDPVVYARRNALENIENLQPTLTAIPETSREKQMASKTFRPTASHNSSMEVDISVTEVKMQVSHSDSTLTNISPSTSLKKPVPTPRGKASPVRSLSLQTRVKSVTEVKQRPKTVIQQKQGSLRRKFPAETETTLRSRVSDVLKRSSGLKGGEAYKAKKIKLITTQMSKSLPKDSSKRTDLNEEKDDSESGSECLFQT